MHTEHQVGGAGRGGGGGGVGHVHALWLAGEGRKRLGLTGSSAGRQAQLNRGGGAGRSDRPIIDDTCPSTAADGLLEKIDRLAQRLAALEAAVATAETLEVDTRRNYQHLAAELLALLADTSRASAPRAERRLGLFGKPPPAPNPLFKVDFYLQQSPQLAPGETPQAHYSRTGWREGLKPHPLFDPAWYLQQNPDVAAAGLEPLAHYLQSGAAEGRAPSPWFDPAAYRSLRGDALAPGANPLLDYLQGGAWRSFPLPQDPQLLLHLARERLTPLEYWAQLA